MKFILALEFKVCCWLVLLWWCYFPERQGPYIQGKDSIQWTPPKEGDDDVDGGSARDEGGDPHHKAGVVCVAHWHRDLEYLISNGKTRISTNSSNLDPSRITSTLATLIL